MDRKRKSHDKKFAYAAKELTHMIRRDVNDATITWESYMTQTKDGDGAGMCIVEAKGYKRKRYIVYANGKGHWYTL